MKGRRNMKHLMAAVFGLIILIQGSMGSAESETDVTGGADHPLLSRMPGFYMSDYKQTEFDSYRFIEQAKKTRTMEGKKTYIEYRLKKGKPVPGELKIRMELQNAMEQLGGLVVFDDDFNRCSTFVHKNDGMETWVDLRTYDNMYRLTIVEKEKEKAALSTFTKKPDRLVEPAVRATAAGRLGEKMPVVTNPWPQWVEGAKKDIRKGIPMWLLMTRFKDGIVNGSRVSGGSLGGPTLLSFITTEMQLAGAPHPVVSQFMGAVSDAFTFWASSVKAPNIPWYPSFEMFPGPMAPPTPSPATPLAALIQSTAFLDPSMLSMTIRARIGEDASSPEAKAAIDGFCQWLYSGFRTWQSYATIKDVLGTGPVPTFSPESNIFSGPVINGTANGGTLSPSPSWP